MANNYFISSVTLYKEDNAKPFVFGPFTTALIRACSSWFDYTDGIVVCDEDDCSRQMETVLLKVYGILTGNLKVTDEAGNFYILSYSTLLPLLNKFYNKSDWTSTALIQYMMRGTLTEGYIDWSDILTIAKLENPDNNILGYSETYCSYCSKLRHDEFVGGGLFVSDVFSIHSSPNTTIDAGRNITKCIMNGDFERAGSEFWKIFRDILNQIKESGIQETIMQHLKANIDKELEARQQLRLSHIPIKQTE